MGWEGSRESARERKRGGKEWKGIKLFVPLSLLIQPLSTVRESASSATRNGKSKLGSVCTSDSLLCISWFNALRKDICYWQSLLLVVGQAIFSIEKFQHCKCLLHGFLIAIVIARGCHGCHAATGATGCDWQLLYPTDIMFDRSAHVLRIWYKLFFWLLSPSNLPWWSTTVWSVPGTSSKLYIGLPFRWLLPPHNSVVVF